MSLAYFPMYPDDFEADTAHLTLAEDGAYNRLLRLCWRTPGCSIPSDRTWVYRRLRAITDEDRAVIDVVIDEFFTDKNGRLSNARLTKEWVAAKEAHERRKNAGLRGGKAKALKTNETASSNAVAKPKQPEPEPIATNVAIERGAQARCAPEKKSTRLPENWIIPEAYVAYAESQGMTGEEIGHEADRFRDYWIAQPGAKGRKADWLATWRNWIRGRDRFAPKRTAAQSALANTDRRRNGWREAIADADGRSGEGYDGFGEPEGGGDGEGQYPRLAYASEASGGGFGY